MGDIETSFEISTSRPEWDCKWPAHLALVVLSNVHSPYVSGTDSMQAFIWCAWTQHMLEYVTNLFCNSHIIVLLLFSFCSVIIGTIIMLLLLSLLSTITGTIIVCTFITPMHFLLLLLPFFIYIIVLSLCFYYCHSDVYILYHFIHETELCGWLSNRESLYHFCTWNRSFDVNSWADLYIGLTKSINLYETIESKLRLGKIQLNLFSKL